MRMLLIVAVAGSVVVGASASAREPSNREIAWQFAEALRDGGDPTLAGVVPVTEEQVPKLAVLSGCKFRRMPISTNDRSVFLWDCPGDDYVTDVFFRDGRAIGIDLAPAVRRPG